MAIVLQEPDYARARPSSLLKNDNDYKRVFTDAYPIKLYANCIKIQKETESRLKAHPNSFSTSQLGDMKYHVALYTTCLALNNESPTPKEIEELDLSTITDQDWINAIDEVNVLYDSLGGTNAVAKGKELIKELKELMKEKITTANKG